MTEKEWRTCANPETMLHFLTDQASPRRLRLYAIGCCRRIWSLINDDACRYAVDMAQRFVDGNADRNDLDNAEQTVAKVTAIWGEIRSVHSRSMSPVGGAAWAVTRASAWLAAWDAGWDARVAARDYIPGTDWERERLWQADLLHDLFGNPFESATLDPMWLAFEDGAVADLARVIYDEDRFGDLPILADALEDAGCTQQAILDHCRARRPHYRGCWVVDLLLGYS